MAKPALDQQKKSTAQQPQTEDQHALKGTLASVMVVGAVIVISWLAVFYLFISRG